MTSGADEDTDAPGPQVHDYRPSVVLAAQDELRLLDAALEEAKSRPRPPPVAYAAPPAPLPPPALQASNGARTGRPPAVNGYAQNLVAEPANGAHGSAWYKALTEGPDLTFLAGFSQEAGTPYTDQDGQVVVDRKRLLAAIICILQEELTKVPASTGKPRGSGGKRPGKRKPVS